MMCVFQSILLGLLLVSFQKVAAFTAQGSGFGRPLSKTSSFVHEYSTSLHVGISYGPPMEDHDSLLLRNNNYHNNNYRFFDASNHKSFFDVDPAFTATTRAFSIAYDANKEQEQLERRRRAAKRSIAAATALVCSALLAKGLITSDIIPYFFSRLPHFYRTYPLRASIATCGLNSVVADTISQIQSWKPKEGIFGFQWINTLSSLFYGSICLGIGTNLIYTKLLPILLAGTSGLTTILGSAALDNVVFAPLCWLPPAYAVKAWFKGESVITALEGYWHAIRKEKLLHRYAAFWMPAQCFTFGVVPKHLRVVSTAAFSFVWMMILTKLTSSSSKN